MPEVEFSADPTSGEEPLTVQFTDETTYMVIEYHWELRKEGGCYEDFDEALNQHPEQEFPPNMGDEEGEEVSYDIKLTITDDAMEEHTEEKLAFIVINPEPGFQCNTRPEGFSSIIESL